MKVFDIVFMVLIPLVLLFAGWMMQFHPPKNKMYGLDIEPPVP